MGAVRFGAERYKLRTPAAVGVRQRYATDMLSVHSFRISGPCGSEDFEDFMGLHSSEQMGGVAEKRHLHFTLVRGNDTFGGPRPR